MSLQVGWMRWYLLSSEDVGQKWKLGANTQQVSSQPPKFIVRKLSQYCDPVEVLETF